MVETFESNSTKSPLNSSPGLTLRLPVLTETRNSAKRAAEVMTKDSIFFLVEIKIRYLRSFYERRSSPTPVF